MEEVSRKKSMLLTDLPIECWEKFLPEDRSLMMSTASKTVRDLMARGRPKVEIHLSLQLRLDLMTGADAKRSLILQKLGALAEKYHIVIIDLIHFGMTDRDFPQLAAVLEKSACLKCLELAGNDIGLGVLALPGIVSLSSLTTLNLARCNNQIVWALSLAEILRRFPLLAQLSLEGNRLGRTSGAAEPPPLSRAEAALPARELPAGRRAAVRERGAAAVPTAGVSRLELEPVSECRDGCACGHV